MYCGTFCAFILTTGSLGLSGITREPLILTPLIKAGKIEEAREASEVKSDIFQGIKSHSGFLTVDEAHNSNLFFWFFPSQNHYNEAPVLLWLQGGPGDPSMMGLFIENGPFAISKELKLSLRNYTWSENHSVIYIDNPVGTGYSFTNDDGYCQNETIIGAHLYTALLQFFQLFPELQQNDFFATGESYAGKYVPAVAYTIHTKNPSATRKINLKGLSTGNGFSDPEHQLKYGDHLYQIGLIDSSIKEKLTKMEEDAVKLIQNKRWKEAYKTFDGLLNGDLKNHSNWFESVTGFYNFYNYLLPEISGAEYETFIQQENVRQAIHVGTAIFNAKNQEVERNLEEDFMQSVAPWISELLSHYRVLVYSGQLDIIVAYPLTVNYLKNLKFSASEEYKTVERSIWYVGEDLAGYVKCAGNLTEVLVRNAGHMVPADQPMWTLDLITRFTHNKLC